MNTSHRHRIVVAFQCLALAALFLSSGCGRKDNEATRRLNAVVYQAQTLAAGGREDQARQLLRDILDTPPFHGASIGEALLVLGELYAEAAQFDSARMAYERSLVEFRAGADRPSTYVATGRIIALLRLTGREREAFDMCTESLRLAQLFGDARQAVDIKRTMIPIARALDREDEEERLAAELLQAARDTNDASLEAATLFESGSGKYVRRMFDAAIQDFLQAITVADQAGDSLASVKGFLALARSFSAAGRTREALDTYTTAVQRLNQMSGSHELRLETLLRIGNLYLQSSRPDLAIRFYQGARSLAADLGNSIAEGFALVQSGHCTPGTGEQAAEGYEQAMQMFRRIGVFRGSAYTLRSLGRLAERRGKLTDALQFYKDALLEHDQIIRPDSQNDVYRECEDAFVGNDAGSIYDDIIELLIQIGKPEEAFWYLERNNARKIFESLSGLERAAAGRPAGADLDTIRMMRADAFGAGRQMEQLLATKPHHTELIASVLQSRNTYRRILAKRSERFTQAYPMLAPLIQYDGMSPLDVQKRAPADGAVLAYAMTSRSVYTFVVTRGKTTMLVSAGGRSKTTRLVEEYLDLLRSRSVRVDSAVADIPGSRRNLDNLTRSLYETFLLPAEPFIRSAARVHIILPVEEPTVPIHALRRSSSLSSLYLADRCLVSYYPTCQSLPSTPHTSVTVKTVAALGHAGSTQWDVEYELRDIRAFYRNAELTFGREANLATLLNIQADVLHLAIALRFNRELPGTSFMVLSDGQSAETYRHVSIGNILAMRPSNTVFLSNILEGFASVDAAVPQLFLANGTSCVITNCVPSSRRAKKVLGEMYYTALMSGSTSSMAFHKAQQELIRSREYTSPEMWAPFMVWGM